MTGEAAAAWDRVTAEGDGTNWVLLNWAAGGKPRVELRASGSGGMAEMVAALPETEVAFGGFRVVGVDDRGNLVQRRSKFCLLFWQPSGAPMMQRAKAGNAKGTVFAALNPSHVEFSISAADDLDEDEVVRKLRACGGAHQPTSYEF